MSADDEVTTAKTLLEEANNRLPTSGVPDPESVAEAQAIATIGVGHALIAVREEIRSLKIRMG